MSLLTLPRAQIPLVDANGQVNREWYRYFSDLTKRAGGVDGSSSEDLTLSQFEGAGIEESKQAGFRLADEVGQLPPLMAVIEAQQTEISDLREAIAALAQAIQDIRQGAQ